MNSNGTNTRSDNGTKDHRIRLSDKEIRIIAEALAAYDEAPTAMVWRFNALRVGVRARR